MSVPTSPFRGRAARVPQPEVSAFDPARLRKPCPAGDYLLVRGLYVPDDPKEGPLKKLNARIAAIRETATGDLKNTLLLTASLSRSDKNSTTCTVRLDPVHGYDNGEPRVDLLQLWANALADDNAFWEVAWAPQPDGRDKRMWARVADVFEKEGERFARDHAAETKVISALRDGIDFAGFTTIDAFRLGVSKHVMIVLAKPVEADALISKGCVVIDNKTYCVWTGGRQIEVLAPFEIVVSGFRANEDTFALEACRSWLGSFKRNGQSLLVETRTDPSNPDCAIYTMLDWAATADVLSSTEDFEAGLAAEFNLTPPILLYRYNAGSTRQSVHATVAAGAELVKDAISAVNRRIDANERDARARDADMKSRLVKIDTTLTTVVTAAEKLGQQQLDTSRAMYIMSQENALSLQLAQIDSDAANARRELRHPVDEEERQAAMDTLATLKVTRADVSARLATLRGNPGALLTAPGPLIAAPTSLTVPTRTSTDGPDPDSSDVNGPNVAVCMTDTDLDVRMESGP
ncbi:hypothetical protein B0H13DRAFT_2028575 [Mycena leptocephala]|nr:hypothetical protein B0H13DRAFT_2028575 [Mycena leptocephala]